MSPQEAITVIDLHPGEAECYVCEGDVLIRPSGPNFGIPIYEDAIVPDDYHGEWGGVTVCRRCFYMVRGAQEQHPGKALRLGDMRRLAKDST